MKRIVIAVTGLILAACSTAGNISTNNPGILRDEVFSVEPANNGTYSIWMVHDDIGAYCTADKTLGETALKAVRAKSALVVMSYRNREVSDTENNAPDLGGCAIQGSKYTGVTVYKVLSIEVMDTAN